MQEVALYALWRADFFAVGAFQGGSSLRILHRLPRFSEDLDGSLDFEICHQNLPSNFALKLHSLLCRPYLKGRDWYDFSWYLGRKVQPNYRHLQAALCQYGPWQDQSLTVDPAWLRQQLLRKIALIDWQAAVRDVENFLDAGQRKSLELWSEPFFAHKVAQLAASVEAK